MVMLRQKSPWLVLGTVLLLAAGVYVVLLFGQRASAPREFAASLVSNQASGTLDEESTIAALVSCRANSFVPRAQCFQDFFADALEHEELVSIAAALERAMDEDAELRFDCHQVVHAFGRAAFNRLGNINEVFREGASLQICAGGFFHGAIEALFRPGSGQFSDAHITSEEMEEKIPVICDRFAQEKRKDECIHGIGHGVLYLLEYDVNAGLEACEKIRGPDRFSCYTGVFMENFMGSLRPPQDLRDTGEQSPCDIYEKSSYRNPCYYVLVFHLKNLGLTDEEVVSECDTVKGFAGTLCLRGFAIFYLAHEALAEGLETAMRFCEKLERKSVRICAESVAGRLAAYTEDGTYAMPFCARFTSSAVRKSCFAYSGNVLRAGFGMAAEAIRDECQRHVPDVEECYPRKLD